jgi:hypothetical protein
LGLFWKIRPNSISASALVRENSFSKLIYRSFSVNKLMIAEEEEEEEEEEGGGGGGGVALIHG